MAASEISYQGSVEQDHLLKNVKKIHFLVYLAKTSISVLHQLKNKTVHDFLINIAMYPPQNVNKQLYK